MSLLYDDVFRLSGIMSTRFGRPQLIRPRMLPPMHTFSKGMFATCFRRAYPESCCDYRTWVAAEGDIRGL